MDVLLINNNFGSGWAKKLKNQLNQENQKKITEKTELWKKLIRILKKPINYVRFYKSD
jgi:hypothetical protein